MNKLIALLFPPKCMLCRRVGQGELCVSCAGSAQWSRIQVNGVACLAAADYEGPWRDALLAFKFHGRRGLARPLGGLIAQTIQKAWPEAIPDFVTWVPVSRKRLRERGYDQAYLLARAVARQLSAPLKPALRKIKHTTAQSSLSDGQARRDNVAGAYALRSGVSFAGQKILVIDDILTTGATLSQALETLKQAGGLYGCAVAARTAAGKKNGNECANTTCP